MAELEIKPTSSMILRVVGVMVSASVMVGVLVWLLTGGGVGLFAQKVEMKTYMPDATGLGLGAPVRLNGIQVGSVKNVAVSGYLDQQRAVRVLLRVETVYLPKIPADSLTSIGSDTLIGNKFVDIAVGKSPERAKGGSELNSEPAASAADKADLILGLQDSLRKVDSMVADLASPQTPMGHYIVGEKEYDQMLNTVVGFEKDMRDLVARDNPAAQAVFTTNMYTDWDQSLKKIDDTLQSIQKGEGAAGQLYATDKDYNTVLTQLRDLRKSIAQFRTSMQNAGPGLRDEESYRSITRMLAANDAMLTALNRGELLNSPQLYESLVGSMKKLEEMVREFRSHPKKYLRTKF